MLFQSVLIPTTLIAINSDQILARNFANSYDSTPATRLERHASQRQFMSNCYNAGTSLLNSMQTTQTTQHVQKEQQAQQTNLFQWFEQRQSIPVAAPVPVAAPTTNLRSHPTQSDLVQRLASIFTPFSMATSVAACEPVKPMEAPEPTSTWGRWFN